MFVRNRYKREMVSHRFKSCDFGSSTPPCSRWKRIKENGE
jgi:hypothetical protein